MSVPSPTATEGPPLRVLLVDDEEPARWRLRSLVDDCPAPRATVVGEAGDAAQAQAWLAQGRCDVLLLDVAMPGRSGLALADELRRAAGPQPAPAVIFVTAHADHALQAFELAAVDYLTKPVRRERLQAALQRVAERLALQRRAALPPVGDPGAAAAGAPPGRDPDQPAAAGAAPDALVVSERGRLLRVPLAEILYLKAELKYVTVRTRHASHLLDDSLAELEARLGPGFLRVHRNALVARHAVRALERRAPPGGEADAGDPGEGWAVRVDAVDEWLAVSRRQLPAVREALRASGR